MRLPKIFNKPVSKIKGNAPEILLVAGVGLVVYGTVKACQASRKLDEVLDAHKEDIDDIKDDSTLDPPEVRKAVAARYGKTAWEMFKLYAPAAAIGGCGVCLIFKGHGILKQRYLAVVSAYKMLEKSYDVYRKRVINEFGDAMDKHFRFGTTEEEIEVTELGKNGKEKKKTVKTTMIDPDLEKYSPYARIFDEFSTEWKDDAALNKAYILHIQNYANDYLKSHGKLFLNQVYKWLGFTGTKAGQVAGWIYDPNNQNDGDNFVDFGLNEVYKRASEGDPAARMWVNGIEPSILLDFNCKGDILNEAFEDYI